MNRNLVTLLLLTLALLSISACGDDNDAAESDAGVRADAGAPDGGTPVCSTNPTTHLELINACTNAVRVEKTPVLPLLNADGTRPPVP